MQANTFTTVDALKGYLFAGRAVITIQSGVTGAHVSIKLKQVKGDANAFWATTEGGAEPQLLGRVERHLAETAGVGIQTTRATRHKAESKHVQGFNWLVRSIARGELPKSATVQHEGKCGRCSRALTHPASIASGIGPECASKIGCF